MVRVYQANKKQENIEKKLRTDPAFRRLSFSLSFSEKHEKESSEQCYFFYSYLK